MSRPPYQSNISFEEKSAAPRRQNRNGPPPVPLKDDGPGPKDTYNQPVPTLGYEEAGYAGTSYQGFSQSAGANVGRKKSMIRPERERIEPGHRLYHYREHAAADDVRVQPSSELFPHTAVT